ncbi:DUF362 domain-containing protein [Candidatus Desulforudis audaxviator]|uniref:DUF362 domain-containing protein n=1 Tax=Desulforudis audaxviator (strain MP104C) TaxID=477974 RepID=B1I1Q6_DESAP|nr:DUF362 domain-containing protein [Candidatus Desulforudis audaxviator]ACA58997.1 protein of unknown function DUF362 [Candidatus Desulforudis audaxviator MP104C]AZK59039.1 Iron-sulfur cluster-binding protein [Candidatus Desulforudis audaxviator]
MGVVSLQFRNYETSVTDALKRLGLESVLQRQRRIVIKPNLVLPEPPPVTTNVACVEAVARFCLERSPAEVVVAEGSGGTDTERCFEILGYQAMARRLGIRLVDLDRARFTIKSDPRAVLYDRFPLPTILDGAFVISVPVLKEHSMTTVTLSLKNMIGICPASEFSGFWSFRKSRVHQTDLNRAILDINLYCPINLAVIDGAVGLRGSHLRGVPLDPPARMIVAGTDPVAVDAAGARLLGYHWTQVTHLRQAQGLFGCAPDN